MAKFILITIVVLVLLAGVAIILNDVKIVKPTPSVSVSATPTATPIGPNITVFSPKPDDEVGLPLTIKGEARTFEAAFSYRIKNGKGVVLVEGHSMTTGTEDYPAFRPFEVSVNYPDPKTASGSVEVFENSAKDGEEINKVTVPISFKKITDAIETKLYIDLDKPLITRIPKTDTPVRATLDELLKALNLGVNINSVNLTSGVLTVDLNFTVDTAAKAQITKTAMQFSSVSKVVITVDGKTI